MTKGRVRSRSTTPEVAAMELLASETCLMAAHPKCEGCGCRCHEQAAIFADVELYGGRFEVPSTASRDLLAHLQSGYERLDLAQAARVVRYVIDLGWRPVPAIYAPLPLHRTEAGYPRCSTCDGGGCPDCTDPA